MAKDSDRLAATLEADNTGGLLSGFLAEEETFDRRALWRLGSWGVASVGAVILAVYANQTSIASRRDQVAAADLARQAQQIQSVAKESQNEARRLASAIDTLNGDRDRLYSRVTVLEQGLESVTGAIAKQQTVAATSPPTAPASAAAAATAEPQNPPPAPLVSPVATTAPKAAEKPSAAAAAPEPAPATVASVTPKISNSPPSTPATAPAPPLMAAKSMMAPPDAAATKLIEPEKPEKPEKAASAPTMPEDVASASSTGEAERDVAKAAPPELSVQRTEFGVDVGGANSVGGLRALWRGLLKSKSNAQLTALRPIIVIKEGSKGLGMQLRLVAGPLHDAAAAAKICAGLIEKDRPCETTVFDGQRLTMNADQPAETTRRASTKPAPTKPSAHKRGSSKHAAAEEPAKKPDPPSTLSSFFGKR